MPFRTHVSYEGGLDPQKDRKLDEIAAPGECINSGYLFLGGIRDREYEFTERKERDAGRKRLRAVPWVLKE